MADGAAPRLTAARLVDGVVRHGRSLADTLPPALERLALEDRGLTQELAYGTLRYQPRLDFLAEQLLSKPMKPKDGDVKALLLVGLYQLLYTHVPPHAAVSATVTATRKLKKPWAKGLINALLRRLQREQEELLALIERDPAAHRSHPQWLLQRLQQDWPEQWDAITDANNARPPMTLRVNRQQGSRDDYLAALEQAGINAAAGPAVDAIELASPVPVERLPGFEQGRVSVQDAAAQQAALWVNPEPGERILDACAAPGGKTAHLLECCPEAQVIALDSDESRLERVHQNLHRLKLKAEVIAADAGEPASWWNQEPFDAILLDAPCSATGVIRRHPDIKLLRRESDIADLARQQQRLLQALWPLLKPGGRLIYATCSTLRQENDHQISAFLASGDGVGEHRHTETWGREMPTGRQILPGEQGMDGFYYAHLVKG